MALGTKPSRVLPTSPMYALASGRNPGALRHSMDAFGAVAAVETDGAAEG